MNREEQLKYCEKCIHQQFNPNEGLICGLTGKKADFEGECEHFVIDKSWVEAEKKKSEREEKKTIGFGISPKQHDHILVPDLSKTEAYVLAYQTAKKLNWNVGFFSPDGFAAYTTFSLISWGEEIRINIEVGRIDIKSECLGNQFIDWGKNRSNINRFKKTFNKILQKKDEIDFEEQFAEISKAFAGGENDLAKPPLSKKEKIAGLFSVLLPTKGYFVTPILINLNILIFVVMVISGVSPWLPSGEQLILWGANFRPLTLEGQYWRLLTNIFVHIGLIHLLLNMFALFYIGLLLEPYLGKSKFLVAYLLSGIAASVVSVSWHNFTISVGASGAIFGMYGVFLSMLFTNLIEKSARKSLLISIAIFVVYNLVNGLKGGIDNAAHIGGLVSGMIIGLSYYPDLAKPNRTLKYFTFLLLTVFIMGTSVLVMQSFQNDVSKYFNDIQMFAALEQKALRLYRMAPGSTNKQILNEIQNNGLENWEKCLRIVENAETYNIPAPLHEQNAKLIKYCKLRIKYFKTLEKSIIEDTDKYNEEMDRCSAEIKKLFYEISQINKN